MSDFKQKQIEFTNAIRQAESGLCSELEARRLKIYQDLFINNVSGFIENTFPVLKSLYSEANWQKLMRQFFIQHASETPIFSEIPQEFLAFITDEYQLCDSDPIFMRELAHYEWLELDVSIRQDSAEQGIDTSKLQVSALASIVSYPYPVHQISQDFQPQAPSDPVYLVVYRDEGYEVKFLQINSASVYMLDLIEKDIATSFDSLLSCMLQALPQVDEIQIKTGLKENLDTLSSLGIVLNWN